MRKINKFIIVDDDPHNNLLCKYVIRSVTKEIEILDFISPEEGFAYVESFYSKADSDCPTVIFLDINMPVMSGWDFLGKYALLGAQVKKQITFYILSSSVDWSDKERAAANPLVKGYVTKPLLKGTLHNIMSGLF